MNKRRSLRSRLVGFLWRRRRRRCSDDLWEMPPDEEHALVPVGPPRRPRPSSAVALEPPPEPQDVYAYGGDSAAGEGDEPSAALA